MDEELIKVVADMEALKKDYIELNNKVDSLVNVISDHLMVEDKDIENLAGAIDRMNESSNSINSKLDIVIHESTKTKEDINKLNSASLTIPQFSKKAVALIVGLATTLGYILLDYIKALFINGN